jgi:hypothetical protein
MKIRSMIFEDLPDKYKCCDEAIKNQKKLGGKLEWTIPNNSPIFTVEFSCVCGTKHLVKCYRVKGKSLPIDSIDIEEGS